jgi:pimeloyl-ACP methyl ester carboxylesterase
MPPVRANGLDLWVEDTHPGDATRPPVVLVMGLGAQLLFWPETLVDRLVGDGFRVVRFDNRDVGKSTWLDHLGLPDIGRAFRGRLIGRSVPAPYALDDLADDTLALLAALDLRRVHLVGASMGGMVAQLTALKDASRLASLTSVMSHTGELAHLAIHPAVAGALLAPAPRTPAAGVEALIDTFRAIGSQPFDPVVFRPLAEQVVARGFHPAGTRRQLAAVLAAAPRTARLAALRLPTTVIHGTADRLVPIRGGRATAAAIPGSRLVELPGLAHDLPRVAGAAIADEIGRLQRG